MQGNCNNDRKKATILILAAKRLAKKEINLANLVQIPLDIIYVSVALSLFRFVFRAWVILTLHGFSYSVTLSNVCPVTIPLSAYSTRPSQKSVSLIIRCHFVLFVLLLIVNNNTSGTIIFLQNSIYDYYGYLTSIFPSYFCYFYIATLRSSFYGRS